MLSLLCDTTRTIATFRLTSQSLQKVERSTEKESMSSFIYHSGCNSSIMNSIKTTCLKEFGTVVFIHFIYYVFWNYVFVSAELNLDFDIFILGGKKLSEKTLISLINTSLGNNFVCFTPRPQLRDFRRCWWITDLPSLDRLDNCFMNTSIFKCVYLR